MTEQEIEKQFLLYPCGQAADKVREQAFKALSHDFERVPSRTYRNGVENALIDAIDESEGGSKWREIVKETLDRFRLSPIEKFIKLRYFRQKSDFTVGMAIEVSKKTLGYMRRTVLEYAENIAIKKNLIDKEDIMTEQERGGVPDESKTSTFGLTREEARNRLKNIAGLCYSLSCDIGNLEIEAEYLRAENKLLRLKLEKAGIKVPPPPNSLSGMKGMATRLKS